MSSSSSVAPKQRSRLEARIDPALDELITRAARQLNKTKTAFICDALESAALKALARADVTVMPAAQFDAMMAAIDRADESPELQELASLPDLIG